MPLPFKDIFLECYSNVADPCSLLSTSFVQEHGHLKVNQFLPTPSCRIRFLRYWLHFEGPKVDTGVSCLPILKVDNHALHH